MRRLPRKGNWLMLPQGTCNSRKAKWNYDRIFPNGLNSGEYRVDDFPAPESDERKVRRRK